MWKGLLAAMLMAGATASAAQSPVEGPLFDPVGGYRITQYRGVVGDAPADVMRIDTAEARRLWRRGAILIDVNPAPGAVRDPQTGVWTLAEPHQTIPGAHWFAESGRGVLPADIETWFLSGVRRLAEAHPHRPVIIFCQADCWMSWNAALRLRRARVRNIRWFADGLDGWRDVALPTVSARPE
ncbi:rhodanese-like domain-containing protein [Sphingomonas immobilis]|uniref:Rhodanese n=1 Tax=Sphingomonas immobilis TaxID=3063997 RepID=A0ABT9A240_9SPHN|nr:rhodanese [Sphingomonas sp. CA1-15]MDO7843900.1 rhodanese [Sphingomonas sp. CA1-15]